MKVSILSNTNTDPLSIRISKQNEVYRPAGFATWLNEIISPDSGLYCFCPSCIFIILDGQQLIVNKKNLEEMRSELTQNILFIESALKANSRINFFVSNLDIPKYKLKNIKEVRDERVAEYFWYDELMRLNKMYSNFFMFDLKNIIEEIGRVEFYSQKQWYLGGIRFSSKGEKRLEKEINRHIQALEGGQKKCLILDLDNTLWGGVIGEEGIEGIELSEFKEGARYRDFQLRIKEIKNMGTILAVVSKNNERDVMEVFRSHPNMVLSKDDFVSILINWDSKVDNILQLSKDLNIGLDSFVFIDDNPVERENVKSALEGVLVPEFPKDTANLGQFITEIFYDNFMSLTNSDEDMSKTEMYYHNLQRADTMKSAATFEDFLSSLETKIKIWKMRDEDIIRVSQLVHKTNQFNLTAKRYDEEKLKSFVSSDIYEAYVCSALDKFGDNGKVAFILIKKNSDKSAELDTFLMSCRVMGRCIEDQIIEFLENRLKSEGFHKLKAFYKPTDKNKPVENLYDRLGYELISCDTGGENIYERDLLFEVRKPKTFAELICL